jgi:predicted NAD/FAD-dependent oxidoreductase
MKDFCIVGSGVAGSTIANLLYKKYTIEIFDKARGPGGRASNRRYKNNLSFDHGLQYISPRSNDFKKFIVKLKSKKILKEWTGNHLDFTFKIKKNSIKYIGTKGNNDICKFLIKNIKHNFLSEIIDIKFHSNYWTITSSNGVKAHFKNLILTSPFPQLKKLASKYLDKKILKLKPQMIENITVMAVYKNYKKIPISSIKFKNKIIAWASQENTKNRFKSNQILWTIQCTDQYSKKIINLFKENKKKYQILILKKFEELAGYQVKNVIFQNIHGWKYAYSTADTKIECNWSNKYRLGLCADWFKGSRVEDSWLSAHSLYNQIKKNPPKNRRV